jgi:hypothetical protein
MTHSETWIDSAALRVIKADEGSPEHSILGSRKKVTILHQTAINKETVNDSLATS